MLTAKTRWGSMGMPEGVHSAQETRYGIHGGDAVTSLLLAICPETVDMSAARDVRSAAETAMIPPTGPVSLGWVANDLNPAGVVGEATIRFMMDQTIQVLHPVEALPQDGYAPAMGPVTGPATGPA